MVESEARASEKNGQGGGEGGTEGVILPAMVRHTMLREN